MATGQDLATDYADTMVASIADIMARYAGDAHDDECERGGECPECREPMIRTTDDIGWACPNDHGDYVPDDEHDDEPCDCQERAGNELAESYALETVAEIGEPYSVLLTYGGPTAWVEWHGRSGTSSARLHVTWSSDPVIRRSAAIRALAEFYGEMMEES